MSAIALFKDVLWILPQPLLGLTVTRMIYNRLATDIPLSFAYLLFSLFRFFVLFSVYKLVGGASIAYFFSYWVFTSVEAIFVLAVIHELYIIVLGQYDGLKFLASVLFRWSVAVLILVAAMTSGDTGATDLTRFVAGAVTLNRCATIVQMGLIILLFLGTSSLSLTWPRHILGVATGLAIVVTIELVSLTLVARYGLLFGSTYAWVRGVAYFCGVLVWTVCLLRRETLAPLTIHAVDLNLEEWNASLLKLLGRRA